MKRRLLAATVAALATIVPLLPSPASAGAPGADVLVAQTVSPAEIEKGQRLTFTITVANRGPGTASDVWLRDELPALVRGISAVTSRGTCSISSSYWVSCALGSLSKGASARIDVVAEGFQSGGAWNVARATTTAPDSNPDNDYDSDWFTVKAPPLPARCSADSMTRTRCWAYFSARSTTAATLRFTERPLSGRLTATVQERGTGSTLGSISADFVGGVATSGAATRDLSIPSGDWVLLVTLETSTVASGSFGAEVVAR